MSHRGRRRRSRRWGLGDAVVCVLIALILVWAFVPGVGPDLARLESRFGRKVTWPWDELALPQALPGASPTDLPDSEAASQLQGLRVRSVGESFDVPEYQRDQFGQAWADEDHNGCDTRNDVLARDLARPTFKPGTHDCVVLSGTLAEPYVGKIMEFQRGQDTSNLVQIDHVVALKDAWQSGAWKWDLATRQAFANDPENLLAVDGQANQDKSASSADTWLPTNKDFRCEYVSRQVGVKSSYGLSVTQTEYDAMAKVLASCT
ncbi:HNH endonuclease family protein [Schaalia vaccimaxillae]|uniref:HNH endonuclease family protein n=1 Tax=Schaalia vaccimaxillae TaxID=183916 RepID=UPI00047C8E8C|nr:HNH endonuclease family protein [Schaalia vaccimaxillae]